MLPGQLTRRCRRRPNFCPAARPVIALLARLYLEMRSRGYQVACGIMSARARALLRQLGVEVEVLAPERAYWGELRAPVRFSVAGGAGPLEERWVS